MRDNVAISKEKAPDLGGLFASCGAGAYCGLRLPAPEVVAPVAPVVLSPEPRVVLSLELLVAFGSSVLPPLVDDPELDE